MLAYQLRRWCAGVGPRSFSEAALPTITSNLHGLNFVAGTLASSSDDARRFNVQSRKRVHDDLPGSFVEASEADIDAAVKAAEEAAPEMRKMPSSKIAIFLRTVASNLKDLLLSSDDFIKRACEETGYNDTRINNEMNRTVGQLDKFANQVSEASWRRPTIDNSAGIDIRLTLQSVGPVCVFPASNFPLAFSVAGGDSASAWAAGSPVIVKAHDAHPGISEYVATIIADAAKRCNMPPGCFSMLHGSGASIGQKLVTHPGVQAVGFTGSGVVGRSIMDACAARPRPIPVYAEMGSINPIFVLPSAMETRYETIATALAESVTLGVGQFCTNPGICFVPAIATDPTRPQKFAELLARNVQAISPGSMLTPGIQKQFFASATAYERVPGVHTVTAEQHPDPMTNEAAGIVLTTDLDTFLNNHEELTEEIFGPATLVVQCGSMEDMARAAHNLEGQLSASVWGNEDELAPEQASGPAGQLLDAVQERAGRVIFNSMPTGLEVCAAMHHGGPYPACSTPLFTSVGASAILRFARPICFQDWPEASLPAELQDANPLGVLRLVNGEYTHDALRPGSHRSR